MDSKEVYFGSIEEVKAYKEQINNQKRQNYIKNITSKKASLKRKKKGSKRK